jgi:oligopeptide/dipeptide ABC transporter ATP-binding protein
MSNDELLRVEGLKTHFFTKRGVVKAVDGVSFTVKRGQIMGLVGESGAGKSITGFSIMRLVDPPGRIVGGRILFEGMDLLQKTESEMAGIRGDRIGMIFQDPQTSLDPVFTIGYQIIETLIAHRPIGRAERLTKAADMLEAVGIPSPRERLTDYPHQFSGGMRQRVVISIAMGLNPGLLIADEPTTALDVTIQAQVLTLMRRLVLQNGTAMILITHDIALVGQFCDNIGVMYAGHLVEWADAATIIRAPRHPYTQGLLRSIPGWQDRRKRLAQIPGIMPSLVGLPDGCPFRPRCEKSKSACVARPALIEIEPGHLLACAMEG